VDAPKPVCLMCPMCAGMGYTRDTAAEMELRFDRELGGHVEVRTLKQGSGCPKCLGTGFLNDRVR
jgi:hypothetical protein